MAWLTPASHPVQNQHFNYTWLRLIRQQAVCVVPQGLGNSVSLELCDNNKAQQRWLVNTNKLLVRSSNISPKKRLNMLGLMCDHALLCVLIVCFLSLA